MKYMNLMTDMKRAKWMLISLCLMASPVFTSCSDDDDEPSKPDYPEEEMVYRFDQQQFLQESIVKVDDQGNFVIRKYGRALDEADTTRLSMKAATMEEARESFKTLFSTDVTFEENGGKLIASLKDENDKAQGTVTFEPVVGAEDGAIARVTFNTTPAMLYVSEIRYITAWAENDDAYISPFEIGESVRRNVDVGYERGERTFVCIREAEPGSCGVLVYISDKHHPGKGHDDGKDVFADKSDARLVSEIMRSNWNYYTNLLKKAGLPYDRDFQVWYGDWDWYPLVNYRHWIRLKNGETGKNEVAWGSKKREILLVERFDVVKFE